MKTEAFYDQRGGLELSRIEPLIACPSRPRKVVTEREVAGKPIYQSYIGSTASPGLRDFVVSAKMVEGRRIPEQVALYISPSSRQLLEEISRSGDLDRLYRHGPGTAQRSHQPAHGTA